MKERPILFSGPMVRAILEGRKTMTRRVVLGQPLPGLPFLGINDGNLATWAKVYDSETQLISKVRCPYGQPGDRLWVRETWCRLKDVGFSVDPEAIAYRASTGPTLKWRDEEDRDEGEEFPHWRPSIHMPRWASRLTLEITAVRVERVQDISEEDAKAEGIRRISHGMEGDYFHFSRTEPDPQNWRFANDAFRELWDSINAARGYGWDVNPWVWVVEFRRAEVEARVKEGR